MKKIAFLMLLTFPMTLFAQVDDVYFVPKKEKKVLVVEGAEDAYFIDADEETVEYVDTLFNDYESGMYVENMYYVNDLDGVLEKFDSVIGLSRLKAIHLNDSLTPFASRKDRHAKIGEGTIGLDAIARIINHPSLRAVPFYLETPNELDGYAKEIALLKSLRS